MRVLMVAPPGAGKGTQATVIANHFDIPHIATGDLLRDHVARDTELGRAVRAHLDRGELVPDAIITTMIREALVAARSAGGGYVLDGVPRTMQQARAIYEIGLELGMTADVALHLQADDEELLRRLRARAVVERRSDDTEDVMRHRLRVYYEVTHPIIAWYRQRGILISIDAMRPAKDVAHDIIDALEAKQRTMTRTEASEAPPTVAGEGWPVDRAT
ncbi:adenylate kinase [Dactylosporangium siamense]|uniref:Adenylate kinase n=1 Tax=Dactylosporangium siamense TaxID=685454 RepID=A0A919Q254_9ACTN|nr:adenylate kinase [Dactylosporangium siamense]GIG52490.1 adenylate kinase [Dactylosporangium siamense]